MLPFDHVHAFGAGLLQNHAPILKGNLPLCTSSMAHVQLFPRIDLDLTQVFSEGAACLPGISRPPMHIPNMSAAPRS